MLGIYYGNVWDSKSQPFMSTALRSADGGRYPIAKVFVGGVLSKAALAEVGLPKLSGTFAYSLLMANAAVSPYFHFKQTFMPVLTVRVDWRVGHALFPVLGRRCCPGLQASSRGTIQRSTSRICEQALQGVTLVVVCYHTCRQLRARSDCCAERGYHVVCLGIRGRTSLGLLHCSVGKSLSFVLYRWQ